MFIPASARACIHMCARMPFFSYTVKIRLIFHSKGGHLDLKNTSLFLIRKQRNKIVENTSLCRGAVLRGDGTFPCCRVSLALIYFGVKTDPNEIRHLAGKGRRGLGQRCSPHLPMWVGKGILGLLFRWKSALLQQKFTLFSTTSPACTALRLSLLLHLFLHWKETELKLYKHFLLVQPMPSIHKLFPLRQLSTSLTREVFSLFCHL